MTRAASGHWYFTLKDRQAQVRCVMFRSRNQVVDFAPRDGDEVEVLAQIGLYEPRGEFQLTVDVLRRFGAGRLWEEFIRLRDRLAGEGLFDADRKRPLPRFPRAIGVVTSLAAAALRDVLSTLARRAPHVRVVVYPAPVQGAEAAPRLTAMLGVAARRAEVDLLLLVRGGGSIEDLWAFNDERLARAIRASPVPVVVGVGHESDFTIADFAADLRAPTPTAAAELATPERRALLRAVAERWQRLHRAANGAAQARAQRLDLALRVLASPRAPVRGLQGRLAELGARAERCMRSRLALQRSRLLAAMRALARAPVDTGRRRQNLSAVQQRLGLASTRAHDMRRQRLAQLSQALSHLDPQAVLERGYSIVRDRGGQLVTRAGSLAAGDPLEVLFAHGSAGVRVETTRGEDA